MNSQKMVGMSALLALTVLGQHGDAQSHRLKSGNGYSNPSFRYEANGNQAHARDRSYKPRWGYDPFLSSGNSFRRVRKPLYTGNDLGRWRWRFYGCDSLGWYTRFPGWDHACYRAIYPGIDLISYGTLAQPGYHFLVAPGADPRQIVFLFDGLDDCYLNGQGELILSTAGGIVIQKKPSLYQEINGIRRPVFGQYVLRGNGRVGIEVGSYDTGFPLIIARR